MISIKNLTVFFVILLIGCTVSVKKEDSSKQTMNDNQAQVAGCEGYDEIECSKHNGCSWEVMKKICEGTIEAEKSTVSPNENWKISAVDESECGIANDIAIAVGPNDMPHIVSAKYGSNYRDLRYSYFDGSWHNKKIIHDSPF